MHERMHVMTNLNTFHPPSEFCQTSGRSGVGTLGRLDAWASECPDVRAPTSLISIFAAAAAGALLAAAPNRRSSNF